MTDYMASCEAGSGEAGGWRPHFIREIRDLAESEGLLPITHGLLTRDNVIVDAKGHVETVSQHPGGILFVGNHEKQFEFVALMDYLGQIGRTSMKNIVKFYVKDQVEWALGEVGTDIVLPVYPRLLATDRNNKINLELGSRMLFRRLLQTTTESARLTAISLAAASCELSEGGVVNIFPCGSVASNMRRPWRSGVGRIVNQLPQASRDDVLVVPYHANSINRVRLLAAVALRGRGLPGRPQTVDIEFGQPQTVAELVSALPASEQVDPVAITDSLRRQYMSSFPE